MIYFLGDVLLQKIFSKQFGVETIKNIQFFLKEDYWLES